MRQRSHSGIPIIPIIRLTSHLDTFPRTLLSSVGEWICSHGHMCISAACDIIPMHSSHVETVVRLSRKTPDDRIDIDLHLDEVDTTASEAKATYEKIKEYVLRTHGLNVSTLYISQIKRKLGLEVGKSYNQAKSDKAKVPHCPKDKENAIVDALKYYRMV